MPRVHNTASIGRQQPTSTVTTKNCFALSHSVCCVRQRPTACVAHPPPAPNVPMNASLQTVAAVADNVRSTAAISSYKCSNTTGCATLQLSSLASLTPLRVRQPASHCCSDATKYLYKPLSDLALMTESCTVNSAHSLPLHAKAHYPCTL